MSAPVASSPVTVGFVVLPVAMGLLFVWGNLVASRRLGEPAATTRGVGLRALVGVAAWMALTAAAAASGLLARTDLRPPPILGLFLSLFALSAAVGLSRIGHRLAQGISLGALIAVQGFRLPLELLMHQAAREGVMPEQMSFSGWNFDIVSGATALLVAALIAVGKAPRLLVVAWNALGSVLLLTIVGIAIASSPMIHAFGSAPGAMSTFVASMPFVWLPTVLVASALIGHIVITRRLLTTGTSGDSISLPPIRVAPS